MPFAVTMFALQSRIFVLLTQMLVDTVAAYNALSDPRVLARLPAAPSDLPVPAPAGVGAGELPGALHCVRPLPSTP